MTSVFEHDMDELTDVEKRRAIILHRWVSITAFAKHLGVSRQAVNAALRGNGHRRVLRKIEIALESSVDS